METEPLCTGKLFVAKENPENKSYVDFEFKNLYICQESHRTHDYKLKIIWDNSFMWPSLYPY